MSANSPFYITEDGLLHVKGRYGEVATAEPGDKDYLGGGYKVVPKINSEGVVVSEVVSSASGGRFFDDRGGVFGFGSSATRPAITSRKEFLDEGYRLWKYDPLGGDIVNLTTFFTLGRGITINYNDEISNLVLKKFWAKNRLNRRMKQVCDEGTAYGENYIGLRVHKRKVTIGSRVIWNPGDVQIIFYDPKIVDAIEHAAENMNDVYKYYLSYEGERGVTINREIPDISKFNYDTDDECIVHIKFNAANNDAFGISDLIRVKEWLDNYQEFLRDSFIINKLYRSPCYDITIKDGNEDDIRKAVARYSNWKIGSNPVHNDKEEWNVLEFTGANMSANESRRALLLIIAAGVNFPEYMLADGANANLASSKSQQLPAIKKFEDRQDIYRDALKEIFDFVLECKFKFSSGKRPSPVVDFEGERTWKGDIVFPEIAREADNIVATSTKELVEAGLMSRSTAAIKNGLNYEDEVKLMASDVELISKNVKDAQRSTSSSGIKKEVADNIINKSFFEMNPEKKEDGQGSNKGPNSKGS